MTFVRVDDGGQSTIENQVDLDASELLAAVGQQADGVNDVVDPGLILDPDQLNKLEKVFESDEARTLLGESSVDAAMEESRPSPGPTRRSQRQVDRETRQTAEKIRAENQEQMKKEEEGSARKKTSPSMRGRGMMRGGARPSRQRKKPKHLDDKDMVTDDSKNEDEDKAEEEEGEEEEEGDDDDDSDSGSWASEDDPDRLWCVCQQPHSNKFMICCDQCLEW